MIDITIGAFLGLVCGILASLGILLATDEEKYVPATILSFMIFSAIFGGVAGKESSERYVEQYIITKTTIESSITSDSLSGFERVELVKQATEENSNLAGRKHDASKWYGFLEDKRIADLTYIDLSGNGGADG